MIISLVSIVTSWCIIKILKRKPYEEDRKKWRSLSLEQQLKLCEEKSTTLGGTVHGWFDALNPEYNWRI